MYIYLTKNSLFFSKNANKSNSGGPERSQSPDEEAHQATNHFERFPSSTISADYHKWNYEW